MTTRLSNHRLKHAAALSLIFATGAGLRLYRLRNQSAWFDDFNSMVTPAHPTLATHLQHIHVVNPDHVPLFYILLFAWTKLAGIIGFGEGMLVQRMFCVVLGLAAIPVVYAIGHRIFSTRAGLIAAMIFALSPVHIYQAQAIRPNAMVTLLAGLSIYALIRAVSSKSRLWWYCNIAANIVLLATHVTTSFLICCEGIFLLIYFWQRWKLLVAWAAPQGVMFLVLLLLIPSLEQPELPALTPRAFAAYFFAVDAVRQNVEFRPTAGTWPWIPEAIAAQFMQAHAIFDLALATFYLVVLFFGIVQLLRSRGEKKFLPLLLIIAMLPLCLLAVVSKLLTPVFLPRYVLYSSFALYTLAGAAIAAARPAERLALVCLVCLLYGYQLSLVLPVPLRTQWFDVAGRIENGPPPSCVVVRNPYPFGTDAAAMLRLHLRDQSREVGQAVSTGEVTADARCYFNRSENTSAAAILWVVVPRHYETGHVENLDNALAALHIDFTVEDFPAMEGITLYRLTVRAPWQPPVEVFEYKADYAAKLQKWDLPFSDPTRIYDASRVFASLFDRMPEPPSNLNEYGIISMQASAESPETGQALAQKVIQAEPDNPVGNFAMGIARLAGHRDQYAVQSFAHTLHFLPRPRKFSLFAPPAHVTAIVPLVEALAHGDFAAAKQQCMELNAREIDVPRALEYIFGLQRPHELCPAQ